MLQPYNTGSKFSLALYLKKRQERPSNLRKKASPYVPELPVSKEDFSKETGLPVEYYECYVADLAKKYDYY